MMRNRWAAFARDVAQERSSVGKTKPVVKHGRGMNTSGTGRSHPLCLPQDEEYIKIRKV
ncbi:MULTISPECIES: hypothetical protein [Geobacillus thermoleovorans group]|uniref:hypothetical protein n=1 Tax=Geobacillus thermoleovorans group TaxID=1505648 RepID=UPI000389DFBB|nr:MULTISPECIES: hypothetical protein [Geobacillus thermoleovorans group]EQB96952.1 hypothetical protein GA8_03665 [Geobacillus sp. A8]